MHPRDAERLGIKNGQSVRITSRIGSLLIPARINADRDIAQGVLQITHGFRKANVNVLTHDDVFDPISGFPLMKSIAVKVEA